MVIRQELSIDNYIADKRLKENQGLVRLHKWLSGWSDYSVLDEQVVLCHILNILDRNNLAVSRNEVRNCFNRFYDKNAHGDKKSYLSWMYKQFNVRNGAVTNPKRSHRVILGHKSPCSPEIIENSNKVTLSTKNTQAPQKNEGVLDCIGAPSFNQVKLQEEVVKHGI